MDISEDQINKWQEDIDGYKAKYATMYPQTKPTETCVRSFCKLHGIPWPLPADKDTTDEWDFLG